MIIFFFFPFQNHNPISLPLLLFHSISSLAYKIPIVYSQVNSNNTSSGLFTLFFLIFFLKKLRNYAFFFFFFYFFIQIHSLIYFLIFLYHLNILSFIFCLGHNFSLPTQFIKITCLS